MIHVTTEGDNVQQRRVTLTFDNGPTPGITERVLDVLAAHDIATSFFLIGDRLQERGARSLAERAVAEGHWIGNHTMTHSVQFADASDVGFGIQEIQDAQRVIGDLAHPDRLFRPYAGGGVFSRSVLTPQAVEHLMKQEHSLVLWNSIPHDWDQPTAWVDNALRDIQCQDWTCLVIHDEDNDGAMDHLPEFLDRLRDADVEIRQDFPDSCVPIRCGELVGPLDHLMPAHTSTRGEI